MTDTLFRRRIFDIYLTAPGSTLRYSAQENPGARDAPQHGGRQRMSSFQDTRWSLIAAAREQPQLARQALEQLCRAYRPPVLAYLRRSGMAGNDAEDLTQAFFVHFLERGWYAEADPQRGRFRSLLLTALRRFVIDQRLHDSARKRNAMRSSDDDALDRIADEGDTPETAFTRAWLGTVIGHAMNRLQDEWALAGKREQFEQLAPLLEHADSRELQALAVATGVRSNTLAVQVHRMRQRLRELVRLELLQTVGSHEALQQELSELRGMALP